MILLKIHDHPRLLQIGIADEKVLGKVYEDKNGFLDLKDYADYYQGDEVSKEKLTEFLHNLKNESRYTLNVVGKESVGVIKKTFDCKEKIIQGLPHVQIYKI